jgi:hypothetical protein
MSKFAKAFFVLALSAAPAMALLAAKPADAQVYVAPVAPVYPYACNPYCGCPGYAYGYGYPGYAYGPAVALGFGWGGYGYGYGRGWGHGWHGAGWGGHGYAGAYGHGGWGEHRH